MVLGLTSPLQVAILYVLPRKKRLDIMINFPRGSTFTCPKCREKELKAHDTQSKFWRYLIFFQHEAYLTARVPRVKCNQCGIHLVNVPWARAGSSFPSFLKP